MAETISLGGKGSSLSSSSIYDAAISLSNIRLDSSALSRLSSSSNSNNNLIKHKIDIPNFLTQEEHRAALLVLLNKLLLSSSPNIRTLLLNLLTQKLNSDAAALQFDELELNEEELYVVKNCSAVLLGVASILDRKVEALSAFADGAAALSCEALRAEVKSFDLTDSGDGHTCKEEVAVASDMRVLLNGSNLVGKVKMDSVSKIPTVHGSIRSQVKQLHANTRVVLNSGLNAGTGEAVRIVVTAVATGLLVLGKCSLSRLRSNLGSIGNENLRLRLEIMFAKEGLSGDGLSNRVLSELVLEEDENKYAHKVNTMLDSVWKIVVWEAITGFVSLEGTELSGKVGDAHVNVENVKADKKSKKNKAVLGKGTRFLFQLIKDRLPSGGGDAGENLELLEKWVETLVSFVDLKDPDFKSFLVKMKDIIESNESLRKPKTPKVEVLPVSSLWDCSALMYFCTICLNNRRSNN